MQISQKYLASLILLVIAIALCSSNFIYTPVALAQQLDSTGSSFLTVAQAQDSYPSYYRAKAIHNPDGIGKYYMGREIARVMGHQAMMWLERESRVTEEKPDLTVQEFEPRTR